MRTCKWMVTAYLLITLSALAQQPTGQSSSPTSADQPAAQTSQPANPAPAQETAGQPAAQPAPAQPAASQTPAAPPTTMDQVVDRTIGREHALMEMLKTRTPLVETYLQNLKSDPQLGPVPRTRASRAACWADSASCSSSSTSPWAFPG
ncbi:MAG: hypothetical protein LAN63_01445 [Acidobacteriia bacterium]|nr:hypothetical protein [Terriglobia bacterium]